MSRKTDRLWTCDHCGESSQWGKGWGWYVGVESRSNSGMPWVTCSYECAMATDFGLPEDPHDFGPLEYRAKPTEPEATPVEPLQVAAAVAGQSSDGRERARIIEELLTACAKLSTYDLLFVRLVAEIRSASPTQLKRLLRKMTP